MQRLSGGNQQKVTIARWIAADARTILCFDPTRGIDVGTKQEIYKLLRELAGQGKSMLFYTSELEEVQLVCDRVIVIFGGRVVDIFPVEIADEPALTRAAYGLPRGAKADVGILADPRCMPPMRRRRAMIRLLRRQGWVVGLFALLVVLFIVTRIDPAELWQPAISARWRAPCCPTPSPSPRRPSSSSPAASTCRSPR